MVEPTESEDVAFIAPATAPHHVAFFTELEREGFIAGKELEKDWAGYGLRQEQFAAHVAELD